jgi:hypothetical protein
MVVDPRRYRLSLPTWLAKGFARLMPRPTVVLVLEAPPDVIVARKAQLSMPELTRQMRVWREILPRAQRRVYVNTAAPISDVLEDLSRSLPDLAGLEVIARASDRRPTVLGGVR